jgi:hypothetical protein
LTRLGSICIIHAVIGCAEEGGEKAMAKAKPIGIYDISGSALKLKLKIFSSLNPCLILIIASILVGCAGRPYQVTLPPDTPNVVEREYKMALWSLHRDYPDHDWSRAYGPGLLKNLTILKRPGVFDCLGQRVHGCFIPGFLAILYRQDAPVVLRHELYHAIQWWCEHPAYGKDEPYKHLMMHGHVPIGYVR